LLSHNIFSGGSFGCPFYNVFLPWVVLAETD